MLRKLLILLLVAPLTAPAQTITPSLSITRDGIEIDGGGAGKFHIAHPSLNPNGGRASLDLSGSGSALLKYPSGATLEYRLDTAEKQVICRYSGLPSGAHDFRFGMRIPIAFSEGGKYSFNTEPLKQIPAEKQTQFVQNGPGDQFNLMAPSGTGFSLAAPGNWRGLQDNRVFSEPSFDYQFLWDIPAHPGQNSFVIKVAALAPTGPTALRTPAPAAPAATAKPEIKKLVDAFGQPINKKFPGKISNEEELKNDMEADKAYYASLRPPATDLYGGLPGSQAKYKLTKTGFFHIEKLRERFVLVDPEGNLFFEIGLCPIAPIADYTLTGGRKGAFEWLPPVPGAFRSAFQGGYEPIFSFYRANVIRKLARPFDDEEQTANAVMRIRKWGFNAEGAFGQETKTMASMNLPYTAIFGVGLPTLPGKTLLPDIFVDDAEAKIDAAFVKGVDPRSSDPLLIGYYLGNEQHFEDLPRLVPTLKGSKTGTKRRLVQMLQEKYKDIAKFNEAWNPKAPAQTFDELNDTSLSILSQQASDDMKDFQDLYTDTYYGLISRVFHKHDTNHLLLGSRWQPGTANSKVLLKNAGKYMDVISVNYYSYGVEKDFLKKIHDLTGGKPLLASEWHYGSSADSAAGGAAKSVQSQAERGLAYRNYVESIASLGYVVGTEWFSYLDQPVTGRFFEGYNGESGNIGLINVADRPYREALAEMMKTNYDIYAVIVGQRQPFHFDDPRFNIGPGGGRREVSAPMALPGMKIDGQAADWPGRPGEHLSKTNLVLGSDAGSLEGDFKLSWDKDNLYLFVQVTDPTPMLNANAGGDIWNGDGIELFIGPDNIDEGGELAFTDRQILLSASKETGFAQCYIAGSPAPAKITLETVKNVGGDGYAIEAAIPWSILNMQPEEGRSFLFDIGIDDNSTGKGRSRQLMWNGVSRNSGDRSKWGIARLVR